MLSKNKLGFLLIPLMAILLTGCFGLKESISKPIEPVTKNTDCLYSLKTLNPYKLTTKLFKERTLSCLTSSSTEAQKTDYFASFFETFN